MKIDGFLSFTPPLPWMLMYFGPFLHVFFESHPVYDQTRGTGAVFSSLYGYLSCDVDSIQIVT
jgi:hypothetical protein